MLRTYLFFGCSELTWPLKQKWFWMLFFALLAMVLGAFVLVFLVLTVSPGFIVLFLVAALILWVIVHSYRNWAEDRAEEEDVERTRQIAGQLFQFSHGNHR